MNRGGVSMRQNIKKLIRENMKCLKRKTSDEKYLFYLKHVDKKDEIRSDIFEISIYDRLENHGMNILIRKIHELNKSKRYSVHAFYRKPGRKELDYIFGNLEGQSTFSIADVTVNNDKWIKRIIISGTYSTNSEILIEYSFNLQKTISSYRAMHDFVYEHPLHYFNKYEFYSIYLHMKDLRFLNYLEQEEKCFYDYFQELLCELFYTEYGKKYPLPMEVRSHIYKYNKKKERLLANSFLTSVYKCDNEFLLFPAYENRFYALNYYYGKQYPSSQLFHYFSEYSAEMYYKVFRKIEITELEQKMRKYLNSRKKAVSAKDMKWMINKLRGIEEKESSIRRNTEQKPEWKKKWQRYDKKTWIEEDIVSQNSASSHFKDLYKKNLEYLQAISTTRDNKIVYIITIISLIVAFVGLIISVWPIIKPEDKDITNNNHYEYEYNDYSETNEYNYSVF